MVSAAQNACSFAAASSAAALSLASRSPAVSPGAEVNEVVVLVVDVIVSVNVVDVLVVVDVIVVLVVVIGMQRANSLSLHDPESVHTIAPALDLPTLSLPDSTPRSSCPTSHTKIQTLPFHFPKPCFVPNLSSG